jgi:hypothetical protein
MRTRICRLVGVTGSVLLLAACQSVGPIAIDAGRDRYNSIIQSTSKEQTLSNIIRVYNHEPTSFMDVSEVDATTSFSGNVSGTLSNIGAIAGTKSTSAGTISGQVGSVTSGVTYSEAPIIRYTPLLGQSLVAQLVTPVSVDALEYLAESSWQPSPLFDLASSYLTPALTEFYPALNITSELYDDGALSFVATKSELTRPQGEPGSEQTARTPSGTLTLQVANKPAGGGPDDALDIYLLPLREHEPSRQLAEGRRVLQLWIRLLWIYSGSQPKFTPRDPRRCAQMGLAMNPSLLRMWDLRLGSGRGSFALDAIRECLPNFIELRTAPVAPGKVFSAGLSSGAPLLKTYSALGLLKNATERPHPRFGFVSRELYDTIRSYPWNQNGDVLSFYTLLPESENPGDEASPPQNQAAEAAKIDREVSNWIERPQADVFVYDPSGRISPEDFVRGNRRLGFLRRYILIIVDDQPPANAYVSHFAEGKWYYIAGDDEISQKNFDLVSLFLTMMAIPSAVPPIAPTISVGSQ